MAVKHYLRGEEGINYVDLYHLIKYLPAYALPFGILPSPPDSEHYQEQSSEYGESTALEQQELPHPVTNSNRSRTQGDHFHTRENTLTREEPVLLPARNPPPFGIFDIFPLSLLVGPLLRRGFNIGGKRAQRVRAKQAGKVKRGRGVGEAIVSHNIPLEITLYLVSVSQLVNTPSIVTHECVIQSSYIAALQQRKICDVPTTNLLLASLNGMVDSLSGVERIVTTPIPFSFSVHLWTITLLYCAALPFQLVDALDWVAIPGTAIATFIFVGYVVLSMIIGTKLTSFRFFGIEPSRRDRESIR